jgi:hypothetical protein
MDSEQITQLRKQVRQAWLRLAADQRALTKLLGRCPPELVAETKAWLSEARPRCAPSRNQKPRRARSEAALNRKNTKTRDDYVRAFWASVDKTGECWVWRGPVARTSGLPRGRFFMLGQRWIAHRLSWWLQHGEIPSELCVCHRCDNSLCVRPDHLFLGTQQANVADMDRKGRRVSVRGERCGSAKLTAEQVCAARERHARGESQASIARSLNIAPVTINQIVHRKIWKHVA